MSSVRPAPDPSLPDLSACEREPIHVPSAIEPHGVLLIIQEQSLLIVQVSANTLRVLGFAPEALLGKPLTDVLAAEDIHRLINPPPRDGKRRYVGGVRVANIEQSFDVLLQRQQLMLVVELEPCSASAAGSGNADIYASFTDALADFEGPLRLGELCRRITSSIRHVTGFDRVMVYRFLEDDSGSVIAEDRREDLVSYLGLRYPATDIPAQARRLYLLNTLRLKPDVNARRAPLIPTVNPVTGDPLDMTYCVLRAMSPVHDEYLRNMGVTASMSISIINDGKLWGLIACHHAEAKFVPHAIRITCEVLARVFCSHIAAAEDEEKRSRVASIRGLTTRLLRRFRDRENIASVLVEEGEWILASGRSGGVACLLRGHLTLLGNTPDPGQIEALISWLGANQPEHLFVTERLASAYTPAQAFEEHASGLLSARIAPGGSDFILWLRPSITRVVNWAGDPAKPFQDSSAGQRINPRRSFEKWKESVQGHSEPWDEADRDFASALRQVVAEALLLEVNEEVIRLNLDLARSNIELDSFAYAASHDLQEPVRSITSYAQLVLRVAGSDLAPELRDLIKIIESSGLRMASLIKALLSYSQLGGLDRSNRKPVDMDDVLRWVLLNLDDSVRSSGTLITHDALPRVNSSPDLMGQLLQNLISNAIKYRKPEEQQRVHVSAFQHGSCWQFSVRDNGEGFDPAHAQDIFGAFKRLHGHELPGSGIGLATCKRIVEHHGGRIWAESQGEGCGATFLFTLPDSA